MKEFELRLVAELMKSSRRSDRELAKALGVSQPTVSRVLKKLEHEGVIKEYTMIPDFNMLGYELMALTFISMRPTLDSTETQKARATAQELMKGAPSNIIMLERGIGLNHTAVMMSFHRNYSEYAQFIQAFKQSPAAQAYVHEDIESFLTDLKDKTRYRPLELATLANHILAETATERQDATTAETEEENTVLNA